MTNNHESELIVLDETGSESDGEVAATGIIHVSDPDDSVSSSADNDLIIIDEADDVSPCSRKRCMSDVSTITKRQKTSLMQDRRLQAAPIQIENDVTQGKVPEVRPHRLTFKSKDQRDLILVDFKDEALFKKIKDEIEKFISNLVQTYEEECMNTLFCVDNSREENVNSKRRKNWKVPLYDAEFCDTLVVKNEATPNNEEEAQIKAKPKVTCFNCLGDHLLNDCQERLDRQAIAHNRNEYFNKMGGKQSRYHGEMLDSKFMKFKAGNLSKELRKALKIDGHQLPPYIYKMRRLGYPPGWLLEAQVVSSGLTMYDSDGKEVLDENLEDGEVAEPGDTKVQYDPSRLIEYPGFNVYPESAVVDEFEKYGAIPMQPHHLKSYFELHMKSPEASPFLRSKKKKPCTTNEVIVRNEEDMEIEEITDDSVTREDKESNDCIFIPPLPLKSPEKPPLPPPSPSNQKAAPADMAEATTPRRLSPSLEDLEHQKKNLMIELEEQYKTPVRVQRRDGMNSNSCKDSAQKVAVRRATTSSDASNSDSEISGHEDSLKRTRSASKRMMFGTPIMKGENRCTKLPENEKFSVGITEHLPFENLPDSVGRYDKFKGLLTKIRNQCKFT